MRYGLATDVLSDVIAAMRAGRPHSSRSRQYAPWGMRFPESEGAGFHVVLQGAAWLIPPGDTSAPVPLGVGDVVFLPHGRGHALAGDPATELVDVRPGPDGTWPSAEDAPPDDASAPSTLLLCGAYQLNKSRAHPLLSQLPDVVHLPAGIGSYPSLRAAVELLGAELQHPQPGSDAIVPALLDTLLLCILRAWWVHERPTREEHRAGWAGALGDPAVSAALHAIHDDPAHPWTVEELGARGGLSRAAFARRFTGLVGEPPLAYLTWWRMTTAGRLLRADDAPLRTVAQQVGYVAEFAFAKAFKREYGVAPGQYRRQAAAG
ncbi:AraC family transcriptional regulator [Streptomyces sp. NPDC002994]|uniref:AraC family transcriptional regulator n=1 Tax=Streptomyces sp. NPDC002994 TaxID=3154441 RepID=UPI0033A847C2